jgi:hypothetical protein
VDTQDDIYRIRTKSIRKKVVVAPIDAAYSGPGDRGLLESSNALLNMYNYTPHIRTPFIPLGIKK